MRDAVSIAREEKEKEEEREKEEREKRPLRQPGACSRLQRTPLQIAGGGLLLGEPSLRAQPVPPQAVGSMPARARRGAGAHAGSAVPGEPASKPEGGRRQELEVSVSAEIWHLPPLWQPHRS